VIVKIMSRVAAGLPASLIMATQCRCSGPFAYIEDSARLASIGQRQRAPHPSLFPLRSASYGGQGELGSSLRYATPAQDGGQAENGLRGRESPIVHRSRRRYRSPMRLWRVRDAPGPCAATLYEKRTPWSCLLPRLSRPCLFRFGVYRLLP
jgi:hypothetical protein